MIARCELVLLEKLDRRLAQLQNHDLVQNGKTLNVRIRLLDVRGELRDLGLFVFLRHEKGGERLFAFLDLA